MKKILGLDLGVSSIGWALIDEDDKKILGLGCRVVPLSTDDKDEFVKGNAISKNQKRTLKRSKRRGYDRYQLRRKYLIEVLQQNNMLPTQDLIKLPKLELWNLRAKAVGERLSLNQLGRVLLHLNQKRGYKSSRSDANLDKKDTEYVANVKSRYDQLKEIGLSIGQYFFQELSKDQYFRIKELVYPREAYIQEFTSIMYKQREFYPDILTDELITKLKDEIIYFQRGLKSQKKLVSICDYEGSWKTVQWDGKEKELFIGPKVAHRSSPLFQVSKLWETINNIQIKKKNGTHLEISLEKKKELFNYLDNHESLSYSELLKILELKKDDVYSNKMLTRAKGLQGNLTKYSIINCFDDRSSYSHLFKFEITIEQKNDEGFLVNKKDGEIINSKPKKYISSDVENQPLFKLWHTIYSIPEKEECIRALKKNFNLPDDVALKLANLDFSKYGYSNKSHKSIRKILPYLIEGDTLYDACSYAGYYHVLSITKEDIYKRKLKDKLDLLRKNSLRQPIVEKILNQMINLINSIISNYGKPDEIRIELARELKQTKDERYDTYKYLDKREKENEQIAKELEEYGLRATRNNIIKWRLYHEITEDGKRQNAICIYCGQPISFSAAISGEDVEVEHIIPRSKLFDDSQSNKTLAHRKCNANKKEQTAFDFMKSKSEVEFNDYLERINTLYKSKIIGKAKRDKLLMPIEKIPDDFINRQLRETQYITRKAREILQSICYNVWVTSGSVTSELRYLWGWDNVIENLRLPQFRNLGLTIVEEINDKNQSIKRERIIGWSKRDDHRHHAIDALTIASTKQGFIQRINHLNSNNIRNEMMRDIESSKNVFNKNNTLLENYLISQRPFTTEQVQSAISKVLISIKPGKKVSSLGKRKIKKGGKTVIAQSGLLIPRGPLSEESIYGKIKVIEKEKPIKYLFENPHLIFKPYIKKLVEDRLYQFDNDPLEAIKSLRKNPIYLDSENKIKLNYASCFSEEIVIKKELQSLTKPQIGKIVDLNIRKKVFDRVESFNGNLKEALKDLENNPIYQNEEKKIPVRSVRCFTGAEAIESIRKDEKGIDISFVKPGNNHHIALYYDQDNKIQIHICTFWHAVERKKYKLPIIIKNPSLVVDAILENPDLYSESFLEKIPDGKWSFIQSFQQNEMFVLDLSKEAFEEALSSNDYQLISENLYRVQKLSSTGYFVVFRHHLSVSADTPYEMKGFSSFQNFSGIKVSINNLGFIK
ncbi:MAG: type II CRISPR RNA-guided endonuclease Cas9 [Bacteroidota bacterium]